MAIIEERLVELATITLFSGAHDNPAAGLCAVEAAAWVAGEPHSDHPACVCPVIAAFMRSWNDGIQDDAARTRILRPLIPRLVSTRSTPDVELRRAYMAIDWYVRESLPAWLVLAGLGEHAASVRALAPIVDMATTHASNDVLQQARKAAEAAWSAARSAAESAAWSAARSAARSAAESAAWSAAESALSATVDRLQVSAIALVERMIAEGKAE